MSFLWSSTWNQWKAKHLILRTYSKNTNYDTNCFCVILHCFEASSLNEDVTWRGVRDYLVLAGGHVVYVRDVSCLGRRSRGMSEGRTLFWREVTWCAWETYLVWAEGHVIWAREVPCFGGRYKKWRIWGQQTGEDMFGYPPWRRTFPSLSFWLHPQDNQFLQK